MTAEIGLFFLVLALLVALFQAAYLIPAVRPFVALSLVNAAWLQSLLITLSFATLMCLRLDSDFSVLNVLQNSNLTLPNIYKIVGTWGNHEGSMLLWVWVLAGFGAMLVFNSLPRSGGGLGRGITSDISRVAPPPQPSPPWGEGELVNTGLAIQSLLCAGFLLFILCTSNPFLRVFPPPVDGEALNPLLQDMGLAMHPPLLYLGYVGFSIVFSLAVAALWQGRLECEWAQLAHPWILAAWSALTIGIGLGSWWAYRVLGWGGFWFWDPVENASLLPWLSGTALLHSNLVLKKFGRLKQWVVLLAIITFGLSLLGTFLTRSGLLQSVHSFASDPARGMFILGYITLVLGGALLLFALRAGSFASEGRAAPLSREGLIAINNLFLLTACATVLLGTLYPMLAETFGGIKLSVGAPYFNLVALPILAVSLVFAGLTPFMPWQRAPFKQALQQAKPAFMAAIAAMLLVLAAVRMKIVLGMLGMGLAAWLGAASLRWLKTGGRKLPAVFLGHMGAAALVLGITGTGLWQQEIMRPMHIGDSVDMAGYHIIYDKESAITAPNYHGWRDEFTITNPDGSLVAILMPEYRIYDIRKTTASIAAIDYALDRDIYIAVGHSENDVTSVRFYYNPLISLIWVGCLLMAAGGITALWQRKTRSLQSAQLPLVTTL